MNKVNKNKQKNLLSFLNFSQTKNTDSDIEALNPSDIFYIGRGQYWIKKKGIAILGQAE